MKVDHNFFIIMEKKTYTELLKDPRWIETSKHIREWDGEVCLLCGDSGSSANLQVHHLYYDQNKNPWEYNRESLVTLCEKCHRKIHQNEKDFWKELHEIANQLCSLGISKDVILGIFYGIYELASSKEHEDDLVQILKLTNVLFDKELLFFFSREKKNETWRKIREKEKSQIAYAKRAYEWSTGKHDFSEEKYYRGDYEYEINEYKLQEGE